MSTKSRPEIIEVFDVDPADDADALAMVPGRHGTVHMPAGDSGPRTGVTGEAAGAPRRWWLVPAAIAAIAAVFGAVAVLAGTDDSSRAASSTSAPATSAAGAAVAAVIPATPTGYVVIGVQRGTQATAAVGGTVTELFATDLKSAERSSWVQITAGPTGGWYLGTGTSRVSAPWGVAVFGNRSDGSLTLSGPIAGGGAIVASSGVGRQEVREIFAGLRFDAGRLQIFDRRLGTTYQRVATDDSAAGSGSRGSTTVVAVTYGRLGDDASATATTGAPDPRPVNPADSFTVTTGPMQPPSHEVTRRFFLDHSQTFTVADQELVVGADTRERGVTSVVLERAGRQVTVSGTASRDVIIEAARTMHVADDTELGRLAQDTVSTSPAPEAPTTRFDLVAGQLDSGRPWDLSAEVSCIVAVEPDQRCVMTSLIIAGDDGSADVPIIEQTAGITIAATPTLTAVVAFIPRNLDGAALVITSNGEERTIVPVAIGEGDLVAAYAFDGLAPFTVEIRSNGRAIAGASG